MTSRRKIFIGNWKMNKLPQESTAFCEAFIPAVKQVTQADVGIAAAGVLLPALATRFRGVQWYAQNCHWSANGAFTGETSASMLKSVDVCGSLVAHSERRQMCGETNQTAGQRVAALLNSGMQAVLCIGETLAERDSGRWTDVLQQQLDEGFTATGIKNWTAALGNDPERPLLTLAYEPVWAIGTGRAATAAQAQEAHAFIRGWLTRTFGTEIAQRLRIQYGGSVTLQNVDELMGMPDIDGALVGGASLKAEDFAQLVLRGAAAKR
jgi:triosephosphate isomerase